MTTRRPARRRRIQPVSRSAARPATSPRLVSAQLARRSLGDRGSRCPGPPGEVGTRVPVGAGTEGGSGGACPRTTRGRHAPLPPLPASGHPAAPRRQPRHLAQPGHRSLRTTAAVGPRRLGDRRRLDLRDQRHRLRRLLGSATCSTGGWRDASTRRPGSARCSTSSATGRAPRCCASGCSPTCRARRPGRRRVPAVVRGARHDAVAGVPVLADPRPQRLPPRRPRRLAAELVAVAKAVNTAGVVVRSRSGWYAVGLVVVLRSAPSRSGRARVLRCGRDHRLGVLVAWHGPPRPSCRWSTPRPTRGGRDPLAPGAGRWCSPWRSARPRQAGPLRVGPPRRRPVGTRSRRRPLGGPGATGPRSSWPRPRSACRRCVVSLAAGAPGSAVRLRPTVPGRPHRPVRGVVAPGPPRGT